MKSILYLFFFLILYKAYSFEYIRTINGKRNIVTTYDISKSENGTFTDNLVIYVKVYSFKIVKLEGYGQSTYQNKEILYLEGLEINKNKIQG